MHRLKQRIKKALIPRNKLLVFNFHQSTPVFNSHKNDKYIWSDLEFFESQINYLKDNFEILRLDQAIRELRSGKLKRTMVSITFDDGDISVQDHVIPLLTKLNVPATFFINTSYLTTEQKGYWFNIYNYFNSDPEKRKKYLSEETKEIAGNLRNTNDPGYYLDNYKKIEVLSEFINKDTGFYLRLEFLKILNPELFTIGLHGHEHQRFSMMTKSWQKNDLLSNIEILSKFNIYTPIFAIPFGKPHDWNNDTLEVCKDLGLEVAFANGGYNVKSTFGILRIPVDGLDISRVLSSLHPFLKRYYY